MTAQIVKLASRRRSATAVCTGSVPNRLPDALGPTFRFWRGASKTAYVHCAYRLIDCPDIPAATYVFVNVSPSGRRTVLDIGQVEHAAPSLNLAEIRHRGAKLGASEVHVHLLADTPNTRRLTVLDLRAGLTRDLGSSRSA